MNIDNEILKMYYNNIPYNVIQKTLKVGYKTIIKVLNNNNLPTKRSRIT